MVHKSSELYGVPSRTCWFTLKIEKSLEGKPSNAFCCIKRFRGTCMQNENCIVHIKGMRYKSKIKCDKIKCWCKTKWALSLNLWTKGKLRRYMTQNENELMIKKIIYAWHIDYIYIFFLILNAFLFFLIYLYTIYRSSSKPTNPVRALWGQRSVNTAHSTIYGVFCGYNQRSVYFHIIIAFCSFSITESSFCFVSHPILRTEPYTSAQGYFHLILNS